MAVFQLCNCHLCHLQIVKLVHMHCATIHKVTKHVWQAALWLGRYAAPYTRTLHKPSHGILSTCYSTNSRLLDARKGGGGLSHALHPIPG